MQQCLIRSWIIDHMTTTAIVSTPGYVVVQILQTEIERIYILAWSLTSKYPRTQVGQSCSDFQLLQVTGTTSIQKWQKACRGVPQAYRENSHNDI